MKELDEASLRLIICVPPEMRDVGPALSGFSFPESLFECGYPS